MMLKKGILSACWAMIGITVTLSALAENTAAIPVPRDQPKWLARQQSINENVKKGPVDVLWIGDSIVQNWEKQGKPVWDKYYAHRNAVNLGISGDRTEHVLWRLDHGNIEGVSPKLAIVMIGQNNGGSNTAEEIGEGVCAIVTKLRQKLPNMKILLLAIFPRAEKPNDERIVLAKANEIASKMADDQFVYYLDITKIFLRPDGAIPSSLMPDFEHPSLEGHRIWAEAIEPMVSKLMGDTPIKP